MSFTYERKRLLAEKIHSLNNTEHYKTVKDIIMTEDVRFTKNNNGMFLNFNNLSPQIYLQLENFVNSIKKCPKQNPSRVMSDSPHYTKKQNITNSDSRIINRIKHNQEEDERDDEKNDRKIDRIDTL